MRVLRRVPVVLALALAVFMPQAAEAQPPGPGTCWGCAVVEVCEEQDPQGECVEWRSGALYVERISCSEEAVLASDRFAMAVLSARVPVLVDPAAARTAPAGTE